MTHGPRHRVFIMPAGLSKVRDPMESERGRQTDRDGETETGGGAWEGQTAMSFII